MMRNRIGPLTASVVLGICATASAQEQVDPGSSFDGMVELEKGLFKRSWADPNIDFTVYDKVIAGDAHFQFRAVKKNTSSRTRRNTQKEFWISDSDKRKLQDTVTEIFAEEVAKSKHFTIVKIPGIDTLIIRGALLDIVSNVPPDLVGRSEIYLSSVGEATLVIEAVDSLSGEVIYRAVDRRAAQQPGREMQLSNTVTNWAEVRRWARRWATRLRDGLDSIHQ